MTKKICKVKGCMKTVYWNCKNGKCLNHCKDSCEIKIHCFTDRCL